MIMFLAKDLGWVGESMSFGSKVYGGSGTVLYQNICLCELV